MLNENEIECYTYEKLWCYNVVIIIMHAEQQTECRFNCHSHAIGQSISTIIEMTDIIIFLA